MENMRFYNESILKQMNNKEGCWKNCITQNDSKKVKQIIMFCMQLVMLI